MRKWIFMAAALIATLAAVSCEKEKMGDRLLGSWTLDHRSVNGISDMPEGEVTVTFYNDGTMTWNSTPYTWTVKGKKLTASLTNKVQVPYDTLGIPAAVLCKRDESCRESGRQQGRIAGQ